MYIKQRITQKKREQRSVPPPYDPIQRIKKKKMYRYQRNAYKKVVDALILTARALLVMATGLGKTFVSVQVVKRFWKPGEKVLVLCHDNGILDQNYKTYSEVLGKKCTYAKFYGKDKNWEADDHDIVFATFQSIASHFADADRKNIFSKKHFKYVVVDESHHGKAESFEDVILYFKPLWRLGMTATPDREDEENIEELFGPPVIKYELAEAIAKGWLTPVDYKVLSDGINEERLAEIFRDVMDGNIRLTEKQLNKQIFIQMRTEEQCKIIQKYTKNGAKAIIFCEDIEHLYHVKKLLPKSGAVHSPKKGYVNDNDKALSDFEEKKIRHLITVDQFNEGRDIPDTEVIVFLRKTDSRRIFLQQLGRGLRLFPGKEKVIVLDFVGNIERIKFIQDLVDDIEGRGGRGGRKPGKTPSVHVEGRGFNFNFTDKIIDLLSVFKRISEPRESFYETWKEAWAAAKKLGAKNSTSYKALYRKDPKLPSTLEFYADFQGWSRILEAKYPTWQKASVAAINLGIKNNKEYRRGGYKADSKLPSTPDRLYPDFPGWSVFLKNSFYPTWQQASKAVVKLGIISSLKYRKGAYKVDPRLPAKPGDFYPDFPGWSVFLKNSKGFYLTWQQASKASIKLKMKISRDYREGAYKADPKLPARPDRLYPDFPGWCIFLGKN